MVIINLNNQKLHKVITFLILIISLFISVLLYFYDDYLTNLASSLLASLFSIFLAYIIFIIEKRAYSKEKRKNRQNKIKNLLHELDYNLGIPFYILDNFETFLGSIEKKVISLSSKEDLIPQNQIRLIKKRLIYLIKIYKEKMNNKSNKRKLECFMKQFESLIEEFKFDFGNDIEAKIIKIVPITWFTFELPNSVIDHFFVSFEDLERTDFEIRKLIIEVKHITNVYKTDMAIINQCDFNDEDNFSDNFKRVYFFNAGKNHIHYVHEFIEKYSLFAQRLIERDVQLKKYYNKHRNDLKRLRRALEKKEF
ncbi:hypothetical protein J4232_02530 [Candidatus Woesearchaeota archaeon]|nr:hypothetical protein [Candidatus Woesearchaeota archaeon]